MLDVDPLLDKPAASKNFFKAEKIDITWNKQGTACLVRTATETDATGKSYYGETNLYYMGVKSGESIHVQLGGANSGSPSPPFPPALSLNYPAFPLGRHNQLPTGLVCLGIFLAPGLVCHASGSHRCCDSYSPDIILLLPRLSRLYILPLTLLVDYDGDVPLQTTPRQTGPTVRLRLEPERRGVRGGVRLHAGKG